MSSSYCSFDILYSGALAVASSAFIIRPFGWHKNSFVAEGGGRAALSRKFLYPL